MDLSAKSMLYRSIQTALVFLALDLTVGTSSVISNKPDTFDSSSRHSSLLTGRRIYSIRTLTPACVTDASAEGRLQVVFSPEVLTHDWSALKEAFAQYREDLEEHPPLEEALRTAQNLLAAVQSVARRYGGCVCDIPTNATVIGRFRTVITQLFLMMQFTLMAGEQNYGNSWISLFSPIFEQCLPALQALKVICGSLGIDLGAVLGRVNLNTQVFQRVGLDVTSLVGIDLQLVGGPVEG